MTQEEENMAVQAAAHYRCDGKSFVRLFFSSEPLRISLFYVTKVYEKEVAALIPDEGISEYVSKFNTTSQIKNLLSKSLAMIKQIIS